MVKKSINFLLYFYKHIPNYFNLLLDVVTKCDFNGKYDELNNEANGYYLPYNFTTSELLEKCKYQIN